MANRIFGDKDVLKPAEHVVSCELGDGLALLNLKTNIYFSLNEVGAKIWVLAQHGSDIETILKLLQDEYDVAEDVLLSDVNEIISDMSDAGLIRAE